jgi:hypothetical protein
MSMEGVALFRPKVADIFLETRAKSPRCRASAQTACARCDHPRSSMKKGAGVAQSGFPPMQPLLHSSGSRLSPSSSPSPACAYRYGLKNVPTHLEIIAESPACHAGAVTKSGALGTPSCGCVTDQPRSALSRCPIEFELIETHKGRVPVRGSDHTEFGGFPRSTTR